MENALLEVNTNFTEMDREHFFSLFMDIRKMYNLFRINDKSDTNAKMRAYDYVLDNLTDTLFFEEQLRHRNLTIKDCFLKY
jgi:hypothetical protein